MEAHLEIEYKVLITKVQFEQLLNFFPNHQTLEHVNHYYAYSDPTVRLVSRIRTQSDHAVLTFKMDQEEGLLEYNFEVDSPNIAIFQRADVLNFLHQNHLMGNFQSIGQLKTIRHLILEDHQEICIDENHYNGITDYELEVESTKDAKKAYQRFHELCAIHHIEETKTVSKYGRFLKQIRQ